MSVTATEHMWQMVRDELFSDFTIIVNDGENPTKEFKVHRLFLKIGSPVFRAMLENDMKEAKSGVCEIKDVKTELMELILRHIYGCKFDEYLDLEDTLDLITAADKYAIQSLISDSTKHIIENVLNIRNCAKLLSNSGFLSIFNDIKDKCYEVFKENASELLGNGLNRDKFMVNISEDVLLEILDFDDINVGSELEIIKFVEVWVSKKVEETDGTFLHDIAIRKVLEKNILAKIRFLTLYKEEFYQYFSLCGWFTSGERKFILNSKGYSIPPNFPIYLSNSSTKRRLERRVKDPEPKESNKILVQLGEMIKPSSSTSIIFTGACAACDFFFHSVKGGNKLIGFTFCCSYRHNNSNNYHGQTSSKDPFSVKITDETGCTIDIVGFQIGKLNEEWSCYLNYPLILKKNKKYRMTLKYHAGPDMICYTQSILKDISNNIIISENGKLGPIRHLILQ